MSTLREHLKKAHESIATHHRTMSKCHGDAMGKAVAGNPEHEFHKGARAAHDAAADAHDQMCQECMKVTGDELNKNTADLVKRLEHLENTIQPTRVSAVAPNAPGVRAVPRAGQQPIPDRPNVPIQFEKLVAIEE